MAECACPQCAWQRTQPGLPYIPVGVELLAILDAHPDQVSHLDDAVPIPQTTGLPVRQPPPHRTAMG